ncbi:MAG: hypothetical protein QNJ67_14180 [Kiloniellales bacterium]|nr:hypothetical protein [Kiloniellales bacterium]
MAQEQLAIMTEPGAAATDVAQQDRFGWTALPVSLLVETDPDEVGWTEDGLAAFSLTSAPAASNATLSWQIDLGDLGFSAPEGRADSFAFGALPDEPRGFRGQSGLGSLNLSLMGDYGRDRRPVRDGLSVVDSPKLLRYGVVFESGGWQFGSTFGNKANPIKPAEKLAWNAQARYDAGPVSMGLVYSYMIDRDASDGEQADALGTLQAGVSYAITPKVSASVNAAYWDSKDANGETLSDLGGLLGLSWRF